MKPRRFTLNLVIYCMTCSALVHLVAGHAGSYTGGDVNFLDSAYPHPRIVLIGATGTGKSSVANVLLGRGLDAKSSSSGRCFQAESGDDAVTADVCAEEGAWLGDEARGKVTVIDTPGMGDRDVKKDSEATEKIIRFLKENIKYVDAFVIFFNGNEGRTTWSMVSMIKQFENMFGPKFWDNVIFEVTFWEYDEENIRQRNLNKETEKSFAMGRNERFKQEFETLKNRGKDIDSVFIHPLYNEDNPKEKEEFLKNTEKLFKFAKAAKPFACKDIKFVLGAVEMFQQEKENLINAKKELEEKIEALQGGESEVKVKTRLVGLSSGEAAGLGVGMLLLGVVIGAGIMFILFRNS